MRRLESKIKEQVKVVAAYTNETPSNRCVVAGAGFASCASC